MKVLAFTEGPNHVCYRYRIAAFAGALAARGWTLESLPLSPHTLPRSAQLRLAASADVVVLQRKLLPLWQLRLLRKFARLLVYDFDDALFCRDSYNSKGPTSWTRLAHFWATVYAADLVTGGNRFLCQQAADYIQPDRVHLLPTCVDPHLYPLRQHQRRGTDARLVWIGQHSTLPCLSRAEDLLAAASRQLPGLRLRVICNQFPNLTDIEVEPRQWSAATEAADVATADIGVSWLPDDTWSEGKCGLKVLQYMAAGLPVVANPVGMNRELVVHGQTGFLATSPGEWADSIGRLCADPALRRRLGESGRDMVRQHYNAAHWGPKFAQLIDDLHGDRLGQTSPSHVTDHLTGDHFVAGAS